MNWIFPIEAYLYMMLYMMVIYVGSICAIATAFKIQVLEIDIFKGPLKKKYKVDGITINRKTFPISSSITFLEKLKLNEPGAETLRRPGYKAIDEAPFYQRTLIALAGCVGLAIVALPILGQSAFLVHVQQGVMHIIKGGISPCTAGQHYVGTFFTLYEASIFSAFAILATKQIAFNLIPAAGTPLFSIIYWPIKERFSGSFIERLILKISLFLAFAWLLILMGWLMALGSYFFPFVNERICS